MAFDSLRKTESVVIHRLADPEERYKDLKDPSVVRMPDGSYEMFASIGNSKTEIWKVGHFKANEMNGPWTEMEPVQFTTPAGLRHTLDGLNCCAPAVRIEEKEGKPFYKMYIQTTCFQEKGAIAIASSSDGTHFTAQPETLATIETVGPIHAPLVNVYDVGISDIIHKGEKRIFSVYTGCTETGCGDLYYSSRPATGTEKHWEPGRPLLSQADVPFHNQPCNKERFEWGLEAGQVIQLDRDLYLLAAVCFLDKAGKEHNGTRQRVFFAASHSPAGKFTPLGVAVEPLCGENGHADMRIEDDKLKMLFQERTGEGEPWKLRYGTFELEQLKQAAREHLASADKGKSWEEKFHAPAPSSHQTERQGQTFALR